MDWIGDADKHRWDIAEVCGRTSHIEQKERKKSLFFTKMPLFEKDDVFLQNI
ncbi:MAG: hypothetical protein IKT00_11890 [Prevotella sp.]|nr:hypothetical protein [Prevotella sp.]